MSDVCTRCKGRRWIPCLETEGALLREVPGVSISCPDCNLSGVVGGLDLKQAVELILSRQWQPISDAPREGTWVETVAKNAAGSWCVPRVLRWGVSGFWDNGLPIPAYHPPLFYRLLGLLPDGSEVKK